MLLLDNVHITVGLGYTNTSREIEALQDALKQVGLGTIEGEDYTLKDSSTMQGMIISCIICLILLS